MWLELVAAIVDRRSGRPEAAAQRLTACTSSQPEDPDIVFLLGECLRESGDWPEAAKAYARAKTLDETHAEAWAGHGVSLILQGRREEGLAACDRARTLRPDLAAAWRYRAHGLLREGRLAEAAAASEEALRLEPYAPEGEALQAHVWHRAGLSQGARRQLDQLIVRQPSMPEAYAHRAVLRLVDGDLEGAHDDVAQALALRPRLPAALALKARLHAARGETEPALRLLDELGRLDPHNPDWALQHLDLLESIGRWSEAAARCEQAFAAHGRHRILRLRLAVTRLRHEDLNGALPLIPGAGPGIDTFEAWRLAGVALRSAGETHIARACLEQACERYQEPACQILLAELRLETGDAEQALLALATIDPAPIEALLTRARALERLGRPEEALAALENAVAEHPRHALAHLRLGILARQLGRFALAEGALREAARRSPGEPASHEQLGILLSERDEREAAEAALREAARIAPQAHSVRLNLAVLLARVKRFTEAEAVLRELARSHPADPAVWKNLASVLVAQRRHTEALEVAERLVDMLPGDESAHTLQLSSLEALKRADAAMEAARAWLVQAPGSASAQAAFALACSRAERHEEALEASRSLATLEPDSVRSQEVAGIVHSSAGRYGLAVQAFRAGLERSPDSLSLLTNLGFAAQELGDTGEAVARLTRCVELAPANAQVRMNLGMVLLRQGDHERGWAAYDHRTGALRGPRSLLDARTAQGTTPDLSQCSILVRAEQGLGDTLHFMRYLRRLAAECRELHFQLPRAIAWTAWGLGRSLRVHTYEDVVPEPDYHVSLLSLPGYYGTRADSIPAEIPYLKADPERIRRWGTRLGERGFRVGIVWQTDPNHGNTRRWIPLRELAGLAQLPGVRLISLQKHHGLEQLETLPADCPVETLGEAFDSGPDAFADTAAVLMSVDLVITIDTAMAHLAGAMGRPAWVLLPQPSDWRWMTGRADTPWYPSLRLFRQVHPNDWMPVTEAMQNRLRAVLHGDSPAIWAVDDEPNPVARSA